MVLRGKFNILMVPETCKETYQTQCKLILGEDAMWPALILKITMEIAT